MARSAPSAAVKLSQTQSIHGRRANLHHQAPLVSLLDHINHRVAFDRIEPNFEASRIRVRQTRQRKATIDVSVLNA